MSEELPEREEPEKEMDELSRAIVAAITSSKSVREAVEKICLSEDMGPNAYMMMMLEIRNLASYLGVNQEDKCDPDCDGSSCSEPDLDMTLEDEFDISLDDEDIEFESAPLPEEGERLTANERAFRDFFAERFDEERWLRRHGIDPSR